MELVLWAKNKDVIKINEIRYQLGYPSLSDLPRKGKMRKN